MILENRKLKEITGTRLKHQRNYEPKLRELVETRTKQLNFAENERNAALKSIDAIMWKLTASGIHLERLWEHKESTAMKRLLENVNQYNSDPKRFTDKELAYLTVEFESYLIQARAFINVVQIHTLDACCINFGGQLTNDEYKKAVKNAPSDVSNRLVSAHAYFTNQVFGSEKWGALLRSLRDRVVHHDRIRPSISVHSDAEQLNVAGLTIERLSQDFENGCYDLLVNVIAPIWEREWIPGPYIHGMWK